MSKTILELAQAISGAGEAEQELLELLCGAAEQAWTKRLRAGLTEEDCGAAFRCAAAFTAAADLAAGRCGGSHVASFTAGEISVKAQDAGESTRTAAELRQAAERLMAPYTDAGDICLRGVRG